MSARNDADLPPDAQRAWRASWPLQLVRQLAPLQRGRRDPCHRVVGDRVIWRTARPPAGPVVARLEQLDDERVDCRAWGPGADWFVAQLPALLGEHDERDSFNPGGDTLLAKLHRASPWLRMPCTGLVFEALVGAIFEQRVTVGEALAARNSLITAHGDVPPASPAGMPAALRMMPTGAQWRAVPSWEFHVAGADVHRAATLLRCAQVAARIDETAHMERLDATRRLRSIRGVGVWTVAETRQRAHGCADSVSYGDTHLARFVGYALTGEAASDEQMEALLEPYRGHRHRVVRLLQLAASHGLVQTAPRIARRPGRAHLRF